MSLHEKQTPQFERPGTEVLQQVAMHLTVLSEDGPETSIVVHHSDERTRGTGDQVAAALPEYAPKLS